MKNVNHVRVILTSAALAFAMLFWAFLCFKVGVPWPVVSASSVVMVLFFANFLVKTGYFYKE